MVIFAPMKRYLTMLAVALLAACAAASLRAAPAHPCTLFSLRVRLND